MEASEIRLLFLCKIASMGMFSDIFLCSLITPLKAVGHAFLPRSYEVFDKQKAMYNQ